MEDASTEPKYDAVATTGEDEEEHSGTFWVFIIRQWETGESRYK